MNSEDPTITEPMGAPKPFDKQICRNEYIPPLNGNLKQ